MPDWLENIDKQRAREYQYVREVLDYGWHNTRSPGFNMRLEEAFAAKFGVKYAITHNSGTGTMHSSLIAAGIGPGDEVIVPALTMASTALVAIHQNAVPVFADLDPETFEIDPKSIRERVSPHTRAIIPVALYGMAPEMDAIMEIAREHDLVVIQDCAECYLGEYKGKLVGTIADMASFSFQGSKHMTCGEGGIVITDNEEYALKVRRGMALGYSTLGAESGPTAAPPKELRQDPAFARHTALGWNYRLSELCAAAALGQLERLDELVNGRREVAAGYAEVIDGCPWLVPQKVPEGYLHSYWCYTVLLDTAEITWHQLRDKVVEFGGDPIYGAWRPVYLEPIFREERFYGKGCPTHCPLCERTAQKYEPGLCPVTERIQPRLFQFRTNHDTPRAEQQYIALSKAIAYFNGKN